MKTLVEFINESKFEKDFGDRFEARIKDKNNYNKDRLNELTDELLKEINAKDSAMIRWIIDTDTIKGTIHYSDVKNYGKKHETSWGLDPSFKPKNPDKVTEILGKYHNMFPNKSKIFFSIIG